MPSYTFNSDVTAARRKKHDERLIPMTRAPSDGTFLVSVLATAVVSFVAWTLIVQFVPDTFPSLNQSDENRRIVADYAAAEQSVVTLAGTSLMYRLRADFFDTSTANVSLPGQSPVTSAVIAMNKKPQVLLIEVNILDRARDLELERFGARAVSPPLGLMSLSFVHTPVRAFLAGYAKAAKLVVKSKDLPPNLSLEDEAPAPLNSGPAVHAALAAIEQRPETPLIQQSALEIRAIADKVEAQGGKPYYVVMPMHPLLAGSHYGRRNREAMMGADPKFADRILNIRWQEDIRWEADGAHLDDRSAAIVATQIQDAVVGARIITQRN